jgi:membrane-anchored glycerophosphoryl diester phosphodiesterase (GDPDase)
MSGFELRPLSLGELLDRAFLLYRRNFWLFAGIMVIPSCVFMPMQFFMLRSRGVPFPWNKPSPQAQTPGYTFGILFVYWIINAVAQAATTYAVADAYLGRLSTIREAYGKIRGRFWRLIGVTLNVGLRIFGLMFLLLVLAGFAGGILAAVMTRGNAVPSTFAVLIIVAFVVVGLAIVVWLSMRYAISLPAVLLEDISGRAAIRRSVQLSRGRRGQIFVAVLLGIVVMYSVALLFQGPFYAGIAVMGIKGQLPNWMVLGLSVSSVIGGTIAGPLLMIILVLCYYDLRIRKEGFDLQHMMTSLPEPNPAGSAALS